MEKKNIVITGASGGIGLNLVEYLIQKQEYNIYSIHRSNKEFLYELYEKYGLDPSSFCFYSELTDEKIVLETRDQILSKAESIWGVVNLAGASSNAMSWKLSVEEFGKILNDNLLSSFLVSKAFIPGFRTQGFGRIINISSIVAFTGVPGASHYTAAKSGINGLTKSLSLELAPKNILVNSIALGYFAYGLIDDIPGEILEQFKQKIPLNRFGQANELGGLIHYLIGPDGGYCTGNVFHINGGLY